MLRYRFVTVGLMAATLGLSPRLVAEPVITASGDVPASEMEAGGKLYEQHCAECHDHPTGRIPPRSFISIGSLSTQAQPLSA